MAGEQTLFKIEAIVADGAPIAFEDGSGVLTGAAGFENEAVLSAQGDDFSRRKRIARMLKARVAFSPNTDPADFSSMSEVQITARDQQSGRRALMTKCTFASLGDIGGGTVDVTWLVLSPIQWL